MQNTIVGKVVTKSKHIITINVLYFNDKENVKIDVYDEDQDASLNDFVKAKNLLDPVKNLDWKLVEIMAKKK